jgi:hypothetical protein
MHSNPHQVVRGERRQTGARHNAPSIYGEVNAYAPFAGVLLPLSVLVVLLEDAGSSAQHVVKETFPQIWNNPNMCMYVLSVHMFIYTTISV